MEHYISRRNVQKVTATLNFSGMVGNSTREKGNVMILTLSIIYDVCSSSVPCDYVSYLASEMGLRSAWDLVWQVVCLG